ncbi:hypothetical protein BDF14DRAFT_1875301 [Spinellus fusiger]|nr:hypothetical protein BDF14DRAFT_1875301 [Spinellus fusiger]
MNLQVSGANIKDTTATLESVGIHKQAIVMLNGEETNKEDLQQVASGNAEEYGLMLRISGIINKQVTGLESQVVAWEKQVEAATTAGSHLSQDDKKKLQDMGNYFSEKMLQALITLDGVDCPFEFDTARQKRREGVRFTQQSLDRVDKVRSEIKCLAIE